MSSDDIWSKLVHAFKVNDKRFLSYIDEFKKNNPQWIERLRKELLGNNRVVASAILAYLDEKEQMSNNCTQLAQQFYGEEKELKLYRDLFKELLQSKK